MEHLLGISELNINAWIDSPVDNINSVYYYDEAIDALLLYIMNPEFRVIAYRVDDNISLFYRATDNEIVGLRIDKFYSYFIPHYSDREKTWSLSKFGLLIDGSFDFKIKLRTIENGIVVTADIINQITTSKVTEASTEFHAVPA